MLLVRSFRAVDREGSVRFLAGGEAGVGLPGSKEAPKGTDEAFP